MIKTSASQAAVGCFDFVCSGGNTVAVVDIGESGIASQLPCTHINKVTGGYLLACYCQPATASPLLPAQPIGAPVAKAVRHAGRQGTRSRRQGLLLLCRGHNGAETMWHDGGGTQGRWRCLLLLRLLLDATAVVPRPPRCSSGCSGSRAHGVVRL